MCVKYFCMAGREYVGLRERDIVLVLIVGFGR